MYGDENASQIKPDGKRASSVESNDSVKSGKQSRSGSVLSNVSRSSRKSRSRSKSNDNNAIEKSKSPSFKKQNGVSLFTFSNFSLFNFKKI